MASLPTKTQEHGKRSLALAVDLPTHAKAQHSATPPLSRNLGGWLKIISNF